MIPSDIVERCDLDSLHRELLIRCARALPAAARASILRDYEEAERAWQRVPETETARQLWEPAHRKAAFVARMLLTEERTVTLKEYSEA